MRLAPLLLLVVAAFWGRSRPTAASPPPSASPPVARSVAVAQPPRIDGRLDEPAWAAAEAFSGFVQRQPLDGAPASEATEVRIVHDDRALYVGVRAGDREPERVFGRLTRRDEWSDSDWLWIDLDPQLDRRTGYRFGVNAAGTERDAALRLDTLVDTSWNGVWRAAVARGAEGWSAELEIPFSSLLLGAGGLPWGLNVSRDIARKGETDTWSPAPRSAPGWVSRFGTLIGLERVHPTRRLFIVPYVRGRAASDPLPGSAARDLGAGLDVRFAGLRGAQVLATMNPDFGQVELDPAVVNLSVFETRHEERRPFFVEGAGELATPFELFFSRRIGARPARPELADGERLTRRPDASTILDALRVTARTAGGLRVALLQAVTARETIEVERDLPGGGTTVAERTVAPAAHWLVGRLQQELGAASSIGFTWTALHAAGRAPALTGGPDWDWRWGGERNRLRGQLALARRGDGDLRRTGWGLKLALDRTAGERLAGGVSLDATSPDFVIDDAGYLARNDRVLGRAYTTVSWRAPLGWTRQRLLGASASAQRSVRGVSLPPALGASLEVEAEHGWWLGLGLDRTGGGYDDLDTRGGPPVVERPSWGGWMYVTSPGFRALGLGLDAARAVGAGGVSSWDLGVTVDLRPLDAVQLQLRPALSERRDPSQWLENRDQDGDGRDDRFLYGDLVQRTLDLTLRASWTLRPHLSVEAALQALVAAGDYRETLELARAWSDEYVPAELGHDPDFASKTLNLNLVMRWQYAPGSTLFVVWTDERFDDSEPGRYAAGEGLRDALSAPARNVFLVKLEHRLGR